MNPPAAYPDMTLLTAAIPQDARAFRTSDPVMAANLVDAGGCIDQSAPDVEVGSAESIRGDAPCAIVSLSVPVGAERARDRRARAAARVVLSTRLRRQVRLAVRQLRSYGYRDVVVMPWDNHQRVPIPGPLDGRPSAAERFPRRALVVGRRDGVGGSSVLDAVVARASPLDASLARSSAIAKSGLLIIVGESAVLRVGIGGATTRMDLHMDHLERLGASDVPPEVRSIVPEVLQRAREGLAAFAVETRLAGQPVARNVPPDVAGEARVFLACLHAVDRAPGGARVGFLADVEILMSVLDADQQALLNRLADHAAGHLDLIPTGMAHGDFHGGNLLRNSQGLSAVLDWETAGCRRPPLIDLMQLDVTSCQASGLPWGRALSETLVPWITGEPPPHVRDYCREIGLSVDRQAMHALVVAYWVQRAAFQLTQFHDRIYRPQWLHATVGDVLTQLAASVPAR